jgi:hypothetical protein
MNERSAMDMLQLAVEYVLIGALLVIAGYALSLRNDFAETKNNQIESIRGIRQYREFNTYNKGECTGATCTNHIYGDELIELIRRYYDDPDFEIYIDRTGATDDELLVNATSVIANPAEYTLENLQLRISSRSEFHPFLVYNGISPQSVSSYQNGSVGNVSGISIKWIKDN